MWTIKSIGCDESCFVGINLWGGIGFGHVEDSNQ